MRPSGKCLEKLGNPVVWCVRVGSCRDFGGVRFSGCGKEQ